MKNAIRIESDDMVLTEAAQVTKFSSMPLTTKNLRGHSRHSSMMDGLTNTSSVFTDRYEIEAEKLDWSV